ncbi:hypothetical protein [Aurantimonas endophytica]|uniref:Uncharacterized protein n=1 Tax=Aurantimonas endophytica TaxID=1522175 RepID=A0A7W6HDE2_9HYPH|nr:hypothetical protein [Aurantimonas endophytica]MBB4003164.1 hypothetical protein [Aurantimonas endophytica]MCO6404035.1 hypothetical protein [Aurantimonas endophytica]
MASPLVFCIALGFIVAEDNAGCIVGVAATSESRTLLLEPAPGRRFDQSVAGCVFPREASIFESISLPYL